MEKPLAEIAGEGCLYLSGSGKNTYVLQNDTVVKANRPPPRIRAQAAYITRYDGTDFVQWYARQSDGCFYPHGNILRLTAAGKRLLKNHAAAKSAGRDAPPLYVCSAAENRGRG
jgi:hypothetical protein